MQIFESNNKNTISTTKWNHWDFNVPFFFLKSINLKVPNLTAPLSLSSLIN